MKRFLVMALCAASLALAADARAAYLVKVSDRYFYVAMGSCASWPAGSHACVELSSSTTFTVTFSGNVANVEVGGKQLPLGNDLCQAKFEEVLRNNPNDFAKASMLLEQQLPALIARNDGLTTRARLDGSFNSPSTRILLRFANIGAGLANAGTPVIVRVEGITEAVGKTQRACSEIDGNNAFFNVFLALVKTGNVAEIKKSLILHGGPTSTELEITFLPGTQREGLFKVAAHGPRVQVFLNTNVTKR